MGCLFISLDAYSDRGSVVCCRFSFIYLFLNDLLICFAWMDLVFFLLGFSISHISDWNINWLFQFYAEITVIRRFYYMYNAGFYQSEYSELASFYSLLTYRKLPSLCGLSVNLFKLRHLLFCHWEMRNFTQKPVYPDFMHGIYIL
jgi:hypothetical protein